MEKRYDLALMSMFPKGGWSVQDDNYTNIHFEDPTIEKPTLQNLDEELKKIQKEQEQLLIERQNLLNRLGITADEARLLLS
jgi:hypothetical protein